MEWIYGRQVVRLALMPGARRPVRRIAGTASALRELAGDGRRLHVPVETLDTHALDLLSGSHEHQGIAAAVDRYPYAAVDAALRTRLVVALDEVTDPRNLGAVARTALASGAGALVIGRHRAAGVTPAAVKASAGATEHLPIVQVANLRGFLQAAQQRGFWVYGAAGDAQRSYLDIDYGDRLVLVLGSEGRGLRRLVAETCDELVSLPMSGPVTSLNVSVAAAVLLFEARRRRDVDRSSESSSGAGKRAPGDAGETGTGQSPEAAAPRADPGLSRPGDPGRLCGPAVDGGTRRPHGGRSSSGHRTPPAGGQRPSGKRRPGPRGKPK